MTTYTTPLSKYCNILTELSQAPLPPSRPKQHPPLTATQRLLCRDLYRGGLSQRDIARKMKIARVQVIRATQGMWNLRRFELTEAQYKAALERHESGFSWGDIAAEHNIGETTFRARVKEWDERVKHG